MHEGRDCTYYQPQLPPQQPKGADPGKVPLNDDTVLLTVRARVRAPRFPSPDSRGRVMLTLSMTPFEAAQRIGSLTFLMMRAFLRLL